MTEVILPPLLSGLSVGIYCFAFCIPFVAPLMVSEARAQREDILVIVKIVCGRLIGYMAFGAAVGYLGERFDDKNINLVMTISLMLLSLIMILHGVGLLNPERLSFCAKIRKHGQKVPLVMGFLMGINICPPFLMSLTYVFNLHSMAKGLIYFLMFFAGTTVYFLPIFFLRFLGRMKEFQMAGRICALIVGTLFFVYGLHNILSGGLVLHLS
ncbi:MAG: sulfite exporter TauE/SafE family protein [Pseudomonadota bacterium]